MVTPESVKQRHRSAGSLRPRRGDRRRPAFPGGDRVGRSSPARAACSAISWSTARWATACARKSTRCRCRRSRPKSGMQNRLRRHGQAKITGGRPLDGEVQVSGAKNAALPILCAALLSPTAARAAATCRACATSRPWRKLLGADGRGRSSAPTTSTVLARQGDHGSRGALRAGEDHARLGAGARAAGRALRPRPRSRCPAAAPSARGPIDQHLKGLRGDGREITLEHGYVDAERASGCAARASSSTWSPSPAPRT